MYGYTTTVPNVNCYKMLRNQGYFNGGELSFLCVLGGNVNVVQCTGIDLRLLHSWWIWNVQGN